MTGRNLHREWLNSQRRSDGPGPLFWSFFGAVLVVNVALFAVVAWAIIELVQWVTTK